MGSVQHHQAQARRFLSLARSDLNSADYHRAANALARAASHAATSAVVHWDHVRRPTRRKLTNFLFILAGEGHISNGGVRVFRRIYDMPRLLAGSEPHEARRLCRQARNRVAMLIRSIEGAIAGRPVTGRGRRPPRPPSQPMPRSMSEIMALPNFNEIARAYDLTRSPLARLPDHHNFYARGLTPGPCPCHPADLTLRGNPSSIELSPLWKRALERTFHVKFPDTIPVHR
ncbi:MAG: hypothetical protein OXL37_12780 [Chloroflexota bacterium]|nr:hypothetical protein [Chloroflexota bacterium]MDE2960117.1 hypothetical protein [Chloroflexota bacterium]